MVPRESQVSMRVASGLSGYLLSRCRGIGSHLELRLEPQGSSPADMDLRFLMEFQQGVRASPGVETWNSVFLLRCKGMSGFLGRLDIGI